jgi:hypothetical protein
MKINYQSTEEEIKNASNAELEKALITCDGAGEKVKFSSLIELLRRNAYDATHDGWKNLLGEY